MAIPTDNRLPGSYALRQTQAQQAYEQALAQISQQQQSLFSQYGFKGDINDQGNVNFTLDPGRQFGLAQSMLQTHQSDLSDLRQQLQGRGLGGKGLAAKRTHLMRFLQGGNIADLYNKFQGQAGNLFNQRTSALGARNSEFNSAETDALDWLRSNPLQSLAPQAGAAQQQDNAYVAPDPGNQPTTGQGPSTPWQNAVTYASAGATPDAITGPGPSNYVLGPDPQFVYGSGGSGGRSNTLARSLVKQGKGMGVLFG